MSNKIILSIISVFFVLAFISSSYFVTPVFAAEGLVPCNGVNGGSSGSNDSNANGECTFASLIALFNNVIKFLLFYLAAPLATIAFVWAGFLYITAAGDTGKISKAHSIFKSVLIGLVLAFGAYLIVTAITKGLDLDPTISDKVIQNQ